MGRDNGGYLDLNAYDNKQSRRLFILLSITFLTLVATILFFIGDVSNSNNYQLKITVNILSAVFATAFVGFFGGVFVYFVSPKVNAESLVDVVSQNECSKTFRTMRGKTNVWSYSGGFGRYFRSVTLPKLFEYAKHNNASLRIEGIISNPENAKLCELHATLRNSIKGVQNKSDWNASEVKCEILVTLLICQDYFNSTNQITLEVYLSDIVTLNRYDISSSGAVITREDRSSPALYFSSESKFYNNSNQDYMLLKNQGRIVSLGLTNIMKSGSITDTIKLRIDSLGLNIEVTEAELQKIISVYNENPNPY